MRICFFLVLAFAPVPIFGQYSFSGEVSQSNSGNAIYLSLVEDYRKSSRIYLDQIVSKSKVDSLVFFQFEGDNLSQDNRIYRIHLDGCAEDFEAGHFLGQCDHSKSVLFIANNNDTVQFPTSFEEQSLCTINSTNTKSSLLLEVELLKEEMVFDFMDFPSETNKKLNLEKWFSTLHDFGKASNEPLVELYIYDFLSDKHNETYGFYLKDVSTNTYYQDLLGRLQTTYPNTEFTTQFEAEISTDRQLASFNGSKTWDWRWILATLLILSLAGNIYFLVTRNAKTKTKTNALLQKLTPQEQKIVQQILQDKSNKEIAADLFVSHSTVKTHINNLYKKLEVSSREEIVSIFKK
ncbi:response regulator transcription factor [Flagellimonas nanhaiensis]|uniref:DNA-binding response regulator n=1 Tax=Flagellimonas nanhaiensis TaxID=2292706 RepID=A0A371JNY6_9FLAO|nr:LuxR C-terminal-related transcriptional regulator [Allomuricauda nanhaiensis]RDY59242.1 DNA-binding response regulator [Allomuricauda nanhaiensis]